jgi:hypothetical protein
MPFFSDAALGATMDAIKKQVVKDMVSNKVNEIKAYFSGAESNLQE